MAGADLSLQSPGVDGREGIPAEMVSMRFTTYTKYKGGWLDALNLQACSSTCPTSSWTAASRAVPTIHPYWGWSGTEDTNSTGRLKNALLQALIESGQLTPEMIRS
jgi:Ca-activated chloride channel homolog